MTSNFTILRINRTHITNSTNQNLTLNNTTLQAKQSSQNNQYQIAMIIQVTLLAFIGVIIVLGNLASIVTFLKTQSLRRRCHYLIISLSVADLLVGVDVFMVMYYFLVSSQVNWLFKASLEFCDTFFGCASVLTLAAIALERLYAIYFPFRHRMLSFRSYMVAVALPWLLALEVVSIYLIAYFGDNFIPKQVYRYHLFFVAIIALITIVFSYICIGLKMRKSNPTAQDQNRTLRERKLAVTLLIVTLASLVTWFPLSYLMIILYLCRTCSVPNFNLLLFIMTFLRFCNSGINVLFYIVRMPDFRKAFFALLYKETHEPPPVPQQNTARKSTISNSAYPNSSTSVIGNENSAQRSHCEHAHKLEVPAMIGSPENDDANTTVNTRQPSNVELSSVSENGILNVGFSSIEDTKL